MSKQTDRNQRGQSVVFYLFLVTFSLAKYSKSILCVNLYAGTVENEHMQSLAETVSPLLDVSPTIVVVPTAVAPFPQSPRKARQSLLRTPRGKRKQSGVNMVSIALIPLSILLKSGNPYEPKGPISRSLTL